MNRSTSELSLERRWLMAMISERHWRTPWSCSAVGTVKSSGSSSLGASSLSLGSGDRQRWNVALLACGIAFDSTASVRPVSSSETRKPTSAFFSSCGEK